MWSIGEIVCLFLLIVVAVLDIKTRKVSAWLLLSGAVGSILYQALKRPLNFWLVLGGITVGVIFLIISKMTEEGIGYGDSIMIMILGLFLGLWNLLVVLSTAFFLLLCVSLPLLWRKKMSRTYTLPFLPFLMGGYLVFLLMGGVSG